MQAYSPPPIDKLDILFQDDYLLALTKPAGLLAVPGRGTDKQDCMASRAQGEFPQAMIVHRLDMATSGILLMAMDRDTQRQLGHLFEQRLVEKTYTAIVSGVLQQEQGEINAPIISDWPNRPRQKIDFDMGKPSITLYTCLETNEVNQTTRVELRPVTGRTHQLRIHMQYLGHPILGDPLYASESVAGESARLLLHANQLSFLHPVTGQPLCLRSSTPF